jgi:hypothetical protein
MQSRSFRTGECITLKDRRLEEFDPDSPVGDGLGDGGSTSISYLIALTGVLISCYLFQRCFYSPSRFHIFAMPLSRPHVCFMSLFVVRFVLLQL